MRWDRLLPPVCLIVIWQTLSTLGVIPAYKLPSPAGIILGFRDLLLVGMPPERLLHHHIIYSLYRVSLGYGAAVVMAIPLGIAMGWSKFLRTAIDPLIEIVRPIPPLAWIPIAIVWFGIGVKSAAFIIFLGAFFPILLNTISGVLTIDSLFIEAARTLNAKDKHILLKVLIPGALPSIFTGMRIGIGIGWMTLVAAEFTGVREGLGLGYMIMTARDVQRPDEIVAGMLVIGLIGLGINAIIRAIEKKIIKWK